MSDDFDEKKDRNYILIYLGQPDADTFQDFLYADLVVNGLSRTIETSEEAVDDISDELFESLLTKLLNTVKLFSRELCLPVKLEKSVIDYIETFEDLSYVRGFKELLKEVS